MMVFARYVMFSEVYWHHAVRSATAMLQRSFWELLQIVKSNSGDIASTLHAWQRMSESDFILRMREFANGTPVEAIVAGLFGARRSLYKRLAEFHSLESPALHAAIARRPYGVLVELGNRLAERLATETRQVIRPTEVLIDAPPLKLEVQFQISIQQSSGSFLSLGELSPVASALANQQFDNLVKRVRVFVAPHLRDSLRQVDVASMLDRVVQ
jgi:uncharacterized protein